MQPLGDIMVEIKLEFIKFLKNRFEIILILVLGLIPLIWLRRFQCAVASDSGLFLFNSDVYLKTSLYTWLDKYGTGIRSIESILNILYFTILFLFQKIGFPAYIKQIIIYCSIFTLSGLTMYFLIYTLKDGENYRVPAFFSSIFYMFNNYSFYVWGKFVVLYFILPIIPLVLALFIKGLKGKKILLYSTYINLFMLVFMIVYVNPAFILPSFFIFILFLVYLLIINWRNKEILKLILKFSAILFIQWFLFNLWWLLPLAFSIKQIYQSGYSIELVNSLDWLNTIKDWTKLKDVIKLSISIKNNSLLSIIFGYVTTTIVFGSLVFYRKKIKSYYWFFFSISIIGIFLMKGLNPPLGRVFLWMFEEIPAFQMFRWAYEKFGIIALVGYSYLFGFTVENLCRFLKNVNVKRSLLSCIKILLFISILLSVWPMIINTPFDELKEKNYVEIPSYYLETREFFNKEKGLYKISSFPMVKTYYVTYNWEHGYDSVENTWVLLNKPVISQRTAFQGNELNYLLSDSIGNSKLFLLLSKLLNVRSSLIQSDREPQVETDTPLLVRNFFNNVEEIKLDREIGEIGIFEIDDKYFGSEVYIADYVYFVDGAVDSLFQLSDLVDLNKQNAFIFNYKYDVNFDRVKDILNKYIITKYYNADADSIYALRENYRIMDGGEYLVLAREDDVDNKSSYKFLFDEISIDSKSLDFNEGFVRFSELDLNKEKYKVRVFKDDSEITDVKFLKEIFLLRDYNRSFNSNNIEFKKINPTKYILSVDIKETPYLLVLSQSFDMPWKAKVILENGKSYYINENDHLKVNGYANAWRIDEKGKYKIILEYYPQRLLILGLVISSFAVVGFLILLMKVLIY